MSVERFAESRGGGYEEVALEGILFDMKMLGEALINHPEYAQGELMPARFVPGVGKLGWMQLGRDLLVRFTQQNTPGGEMGLEVDCCFRANNGNLSLNEELTTEPPFKISRPRPDGEYDFFYVTTQADGGFSVTSNYEGVRLESEELETTDLLTRQLVEQAPRVLENPHTS